MVSVVIVRDWEAQAAANPNGANALPLRAGDPLQQQQQRVVRERSHFVLEISNASVALGPLDIAIANHDADAGFFEKTTTALLFGTLQRILKT